MRASDHQDLTLHYKLVLVNGRCFSIQTLAALVSIDPALSTICIEEMQPKLEENLQSLCYHQLNENFAALWPILVWMEKVVAQSVGRFVSTIFASLQILAMTFWTSWCNVKLLMLPAARISTGEMSPPVNRVVLGFIHCTTQNTTANYF